MGALSTRAAELSQRLAQNVQAVCRHYLPAGRREGRYWMIGDVAGSPGRSLYVRLFETERGRIGNWVDAATGEHGDLVDLIRFNQRHTRLSETIDEVERFLALPPSDDHGGGTTYTKPAKVGSPQAARRLFAASRSLIGSVGAAYLRSRGIPTDKGQVMITLGRNLLRVDASGRYPAAYLGDSIAEINRARAGAAGVRGSDFDEQDYAAALSTLGKALLDDQRGVRRILDVIAARKASAGE